VSCRRRWFAGWLCCAVVSAGAPAAPTLNLAPATADTKATLAAGGQANIVLLGDSLTFDEVTGFRPYFTREMQAFYGNAGPGYVGAGLMAGGFGADWQTGFLGPADPAPHHALDGLWLRAPGGATLPTGATLQAPATSFELQYLAQPGGGHLDLVQTNTGRFVARLDANAQSPVVRTFRYTIPPGTPGTFCVQGDGAGPVALLGLTPVTDSPGVRVHRAANGGWGVDHFLRRDVSFDQQLALLDTDLVMLALGVNDSDKPHDELVTKYNRLVDRLESATPASEIILVAPYDYGRPQTPTVVGAIEEVAAARGLGLINLYEIAGDYAFFQGHGYLSDGLHFTPAGAEYVGGLVFDAFRTNGVAAGALPEPASLLGVGATGALLLRRRPRGSADR
jgi:lysophospholipase L1-like esterase